MKKPNTIEKELDKIRDKIYQETKGMTTAEYHDYIKKQMEPFYKQYPNVRVIDKSLHTQT